MLHWRDRTVTPTARFVRLVLSVGLVVSCRSGADWVSPPPVHQSRSDIVLARDLDVIDARVPARATLESLLRQNALSGDATTSIVEAVRTVFNPRHLRVDQPYRIARTLDGLFREFRYEIDTDRFLRVVLHDGAGAPQYDAEVVPLPKETSDDAVAAEITRGQPSLIGAFVALGENAPLALQLADIFGGEIDFNSDLQVGDRIEVLFERQTRDGQSIGYGNVKGAVIRNGGRRVTAIRYLGPDGKASWFDEEGRSLRRQFLRSPLPFEPRITSRFSYRRLHPIHGDVRPHLGVDFGAPIGTRVVAVAAGVVESAGLSGGAGRMVKVRHGGGYETAYLHLSAFARGIRPGARVEQGALVGYVGMSGDATGPHLDYRIVKNGVYVNPLAELAKMPKGEPIAASAREAFGQVRDAVLTDLRERVEHAAAAHAAGVPERIH
jgi:murein DD-endopeptidase MepM/ murein hydrolase activator NlpD